jgi:hypothetical protein
MPEDRFQAPSGLDAFILPTLPVLVVSQCADRVTGARARPLDGKGEPETPPPRHV